MNESVCVGSPDVPVLCGVMCVCVLGVCVCVVGEGNGLSAFLRQPSSKNVFTDCAQYRMSAREREREMCVGVERVCGSVGVWTGCLIALRNAWNVCMRGNVWS